MCFQLRVIWTRDMNNLSVVDQVGGRRLIIHVSRDSSVADPEGPAGPCPPLPQPVKIGQKKMAAMRSGLYFMFLAPPPFPKFLDPLLLLLLGLTYDLIMEWWKGPLTPSNQSKVREILFYTTTCTCISYSGAIGISVLDFWWFLFYVSKPEWVLPYASCRE